MSNLEQFTNFDDFFNNYDFQVLNADDLRAEVTPYDRRIYEKHFSNKKQLNNLLNDLMLLQEQTERRGTLYSMLKENNSATNEKELEATLTLFNTTLSTTISIIKVLLTS